MKKILMVFLVVIFAGCAETWRGYMEEPQTILRDPHYAQYQDKLRGIEHAYLINEIDYATYLQKKKELDEQYSKEIKDREAMLNGDIDKLGMPNQR